MFLKSHSAFGPFSHTSLRIVPKNQAMWLQRMPMEFGNIDDQGRHFATIGAAPPITDTSGRCDGSLLLVSAVNRPTDISIDPQRIERLYGRAHSSQDETIEALFELDAAYRDQLPYCFWPLQGNPYYNSNSYIAGLLRTAFVPLPFVPRLIPILYPGWNKPVPVSEFQVH